MRVDWAQDQIFVGLTNETLFIHVNQQQVVDLHTYRSPSLSTLSLSLFFSLFLSLSLLDIVFVLYYVQVCMSI